MKSERGEASVGGIIAALVLLMILCAISLALQVPNRITDDRALPRLAQLAGVDQSQVQVLHETDSSLLTGDTYDVSYELLINGKHTSGRCTVSSWFSDMVCRLYNGGD